MANILITGDKGFIGSNLVESFGIEHSIVCMDVEDFYDPKYPDWKEELVKSLDEINADAIFHVGACSDTLEQRVNYMMELNYECTKIITDWCKSKGRKLIYSSSAANYGTNGYPSNLYGWSKYAAEGYAVSNGCIGLRYFNVYGPGEEHKGKMSSFALQAYNKQKNGQCVNLFRGYPARDFVYIKDVIDANHFAFENYESLKGQWYDIGSGEEKTFESLLKEIGIDEWKYLEDEQIPDGYQFYTKSEKFMPGWVPQYTLKVGIGEYVNFLNNTENKQ
jgi:ADP-L-glycero-D-manno-heptose 6-epimerase